MRGVDVQAQSVTRTIGIDLLPGDLEIGRIAAAPEEQLAYVTIRGPESRRLLLVDVGAGEVIATWASGANPDRIVVSPGGHSVYVTERDGQTLAKFDSATGERTSIPIIGRPHGLALRDEQEAVVGTLDSKLVRCDLQRLEVVASQQYLDPEAAIADIVVPPGSATVIGADYDQYSLLIADLDDLSRYRRVDLPGRPTCLAFDPILRRVYASCPESHALVYASFARTSTYWNEPDVVSVPLPGGATPIGVAVSPNAERVFVCSQQPNGLCVFHVDSNSWYPTLVLKNRALSVSCSDDSRWLAVSAGDSLHVVETKYGFGTAPGSAAEGQTHRLT
jgi:DNA-binding beta-propeller fold protein YncE